jgi:hypothetical protein
MTAKRFTCKIDESDGHLVDVWYDNGKPIYSGSKVCDLLNELHEENQMKQKLLHLSANKIENLLEENIQLKKEIENLKQGLIHAAFDKEWK